VPVSWRDHVVCDPEVLAGKVVVKGTRLSVDVILGRLADGWTLEDLYQSYPRLTPEALQAVFAFAVEVLMDEDRLADRLSGRRTNQGRFSCTDQLGLAVPRVVDPPAGKGGPPYDPD